MRYKIIARLSILVLLVAMSGLVGYRGFYFLKEKLSPDMVVINCNQIYSDMEKENIQNFVNDYLSSNIDFKPDKFCKNLKREFKVVEKVSWRWDSFDKAVVKIEGIKPTFLVNDEIVLGESKRLLSSKLFCKIDFEALKSLKIDPALLKSNLKNYDYKFLKKIPEDYWKNYSINYGGSNSIFLQNKNSKKVKFVVNKKTFFDREKMKFADNFVNKGRATYDLRFKNRIYARLS